MEITYDIIMMMAQTILYICAMVMIVGTSFAKEDIMKIKYDVRAILCLVLAFVI